MKEPALIIHSLFSNHKFYRQQKCFSKLISLLPSPMQEFIHYVYKRGDTLFFVLKHSGYVMEFNYNKKVINELLSKLRESYHFCKDVEVRTIKSYAKFVPEKEDNFPPPLQTYSEKASGNFEIKTQDRELKELFTKIQKAIRDRHD